MIFGEKGEITLRFDKPELGDLRPEHLEVLIDLEEEMKLQFRIPERIEGKQTYRIGFLTEFLKKLYPNKTRQEIYEILEKRYLIFLSRRQIERHVKKFLEN